MRLRLAFLVFVSVIALACRETTGPVHSLETATVRFIDIEGGCWTITQDQRSYKPLSLPAEFQHDGLQVRVTFVRRDDLVGFCMVGPIVQLLSIQSR
jgi:hypothetical protein